MLRNHNRNRDYLRSDRIIRRRRRRRTFKSVLFLILLVIVVAAVVTVSRLDAFSVRKISVEGNQYISSDDMTNVAEELASSSWMYVIPHRNILLFPTNELETQLRARFPRISNVVVRRTGLDSIDIKVIERKPSAIWCDQGDQCYSMDDQGFIYAPSIEDASTTDTTSAGLIHFTGGQQGTSTPVGTIINSSSTFSDIASLLQGMKDQGLTPEEVEIRNNHEFSVKVMPGNGTVIFSDIRPLTDSLANLMAVLQSPAFKATSTHPTFDYIDTRFGNKIFFKLKQ